MEIERVLAAYRASFAYAVWRRLYVPSFSMFSQISCPEFLLLCDLDIRVIKLSCGIVWHIKERATLRPTICAFLDRHLSLCLAVL